MRLHKLVMLLAVAAFLPACTGQSAEEQIYEHLEKAVTLEDAFREQQQPMVDLETEEQQLYEEIINLNMDQFDEIEEKSKQAASIVEKRREKLELEKESIDSAKEEFDEIEPLIEDLDEENAEAKEKAEQLVETMNARYDSYQDLYSAYDEALTLDAKLYEMMQNEDLKEEKLQEQIDKINQKYNEVIEQNETFNKHTEEYNALKKELYEAMELDVTYEQQEESSTSEE
ncbi:YkyA family protein [Halobacillus sp. HZG1]|uniref:YkyA family protein n=1 Tax=Halobacillus sp. HZG1 TaxID=3111769 RepID=UPI002DB7F9C9|nr:YkyA family protein [Halobacillus sp. HZG1]MEC3882193.1 YkyA family protein [Halobacillus sp. HZG1]